MQYTASVADINCFKDWLSRVPYLPQDYGEHVIRLFIEGSKGRIEEAKKKFDGYHRIRMENPEFMTNIDVDDPVLCRGITESNHMALPGFLNKAGSLVLYCFPQSGQPSLTETKIFYKIFQLFILKLFHNPDFIKKLEGKWNGKFCLVVDMTNLTMSHMILGCSPSFLKGSFDQLYCLPLGVDSIHCINSPPSFDKFINIIKVFAKKKISERIHVHVDCGSLLETTGDDSLPSDYGGRLSSIKELSCKEVEWFKRKREFFMKWEAKLAELEELRPRNTDDAIAGTFRKLEVD